MPDGKLPPHVMVYFTMAMALFADDDDEEVLARLTEALVSWPDCWDTGARRVGATRSGRFFLSLILRQAVSTGQ